MPLNCTENAVAKVFERIVYDQLYRYLTKNRDWGDHVRVKTWMFHSRELFVLS